MKKHSHSPILVIGAGSWGTALAMHLARNNNSVHLWSYDPNHITELAQNRVNKRYLPEHVFPDTLLPIVAIKEALQDVTDILISVPSAGFHSTLLALKPYLLPSHRIVWATKGMDFESKKLLHELAYDLLGRERAYAVLSGPSYAREVATGLPTAVVIASAQPDFAQDLLQRFNHAFFRIYLSTDITGVEICGIIKNVLAIAIGISDGMGFGANARCALITRGLAEMTRLGIDLGGKLETFTGLAGVGDLILTCTDNQSRNRRFGLALGQGKTPAEAEKEIKQVVEGKRNAELIYAFAKQRHIDTPITEAVWKILHGGLTLHEAMQSLLGREPKSEV